MSFCVLFLTSKASSTQTRGLKLPKRNTHDL